MPLLQPPGPLQPQIPEHRVRIPKVRLAAGVVRVQAEQVSEPVRKKRHARARLEVLLLRKLRSQDAQREQAADEHAVALRVDVRPRGARLQHREGSFLHLQHDAVYRARGGSEFDGGAAAAAAVVVRGAVRFGRERSYARDVCAVAATLCAGID